MDVAQWLHPEVFVPTAFLLVFQTFPLHLFHLDGLLCSCSKLPSTYQRLIFLFPAYLVLVRSFKRMNALTPDREFTVQSTWIWLDRFFASPRPSALFPQLFFCVINNAFNCFIQAAFLSKAFQLSSIA